MVTRKAAIPVPPRINEDLKKNDGRGLKQFLQNLAERILSLDSSTVKVPARGGYSQNILEIINQVNEEEVVEQDDFIPPTNPTNLILNSSVEEAKLYVSANITASWTASTDASGDITYEVQYWITSVPDEITSTTTRETNYVIFPAQVGVDYTFRVRARDLAGNVSEYATDTHTVVGDTIAPANVTGTSGTPGVRFNLIEWTNPTDTDFIETVVHRGTSAGFTPDGTNLVYKGRAEAFVDEDLTIDTNYYYKFATRDVSGNQSSYSSALGPITPFGIDSINIGSYIDDAAVQHSQVADRAISLNNLFIGSFDNLAVNPGLEQDASDETPHQFSNGGGTWSIDSTNPRSGANCAKYDPTSQSANAELRVNGSISLTNHVAVTEGDQFYVEVWARSETAAAANSVDILLDFRDENNTQVNSVNGSDLSPTTTYQKVSVSGTAGAGAVYLVPRIRVLNGGNSNIIRIDDIYFRRKATGDLIVDGTITASKIAANTITANEIAANAITSSELAANAVIAGKIAAGTIVADDIATTTITADKMNISQLSAIAADLGSVTSGTVTGATIRTSASNPKVQLDSTNGIQAYDSGGNQRVSIDTDGSGWLGASDSFFWDTAGNVTVGTLHTINRFYTFTETVLATGAGTITIPTGARVLTIRAWGAGGSGARFSPQSGAGGGGGGCEKTVVIRDTDYGQSISYNVGVGGPSRSTNGNGTAGTATTVTSSGLSFTNLNLNAGGGAAGTTVAGGAGGTASGGDTNTSGQAGDFQVVSSGGDSATIDNIFGRGGFTDSAITDGQQPGGGGCGEVNEPTGAGGDGMITFTWTG